MLRRILYDWDNKRFNASKEERGAEGCALLVDAAGTGYRNLVSYHALRP